MTLGFAPETIELRPLERLQPYAKNAKLHGEDQVAKIAASIAEFGRTVPVLVGEEGEVIELAKRNSRQRIDPLIDESPALRERVQPARSRDAGNTQLSKDFPGGVLVMTGANSAVGLRSMPARYVFLDEVDAYPTSADEEGDPVALAEARSLTFAHRRKVFIVSTPTIRGLSRIERDAPAALGLIDSLTPGSVLIADRACDTNAIRDFTAAQGAWGNIPPRIIRKDTFIFSRYLYRERQLVERFFNRSKHFRGIATRYHRRPDNFLAAITLAAIRIWIAAIRDRCLAQPRNHRSQRADGKSARCANPEACWRVGIGTLSPGPSPQNRIPLSRSWIRYSVYWHDNRGRR